MEVAYLAMVAARLNPVHQMVAEKLRRHAWNWVVAVLRPQRVYWEAVGWRWRKVCSEGEDRPIAWVGWRAR